MFSVTITGSTLEEFAARIAHTNEQFAALASSRNALSTAAKAPKAELPPGIAAVKESIEKHDAARKAAVAAETPAEEPKAETPADEPAAALEYADVSKAVLDLVKAKGRDAAVEVLTQFGVSHAKELKPEQWAEALEALNAAKGE